MCESDFSVHARVRQQAGPGTGLYKRWSSPHPPTPEKPDPTSLAGVRPAAHPTQDTSSGDSPMLSVADLTFQLPSSEHEVSQLHENAGQTEACL